jgi:hypothetical protein
MAVPWTHIWITTQFRALFTVGVGLSWPSSVIFQIAVFNLFSFALLVIALGAYRIVGRKFTPRRFRQALLFALPALALGNAAVLSGLALPFPGLIGAAVLARLPLLLGLLVSMWVVSPGPTPSDSEAVAGRN